jgi:predicted amidohydrolase YtcJ
MSAGIPTAASSDAPYASPDPWAAIAAAMTRRTRQGRPLGLSERVEGLTALRLYLGDRATPGGPPRRVQAGGPADLCLLDGPLRQVLAEPSAERVRATFIAGEAVYWRAA